MIQRGLPRRLHPGAWWLWAGGMATAASRTTNPLLLALLLAVAGLVVQARRTSAPWAKGFGVYLKVGVVIITIRVVFRILLDGQGGQHVLFRLPEVPLPEAAAGIRLGGPVTAEGVLAAVYDGLRLATMIACVGAANVLADAKRLLKALPAALAELGVAVTVALSVAPQLVESAQRVRQAQRLRGQHANRREALRNVVVPVLTDALDRSLALAAAMDTRGFGRSQETSAVRRWSSTGALVVSSSALLAGVYGLLDATTPRWLGTPLVVVGVLGAITTLALTGRRAHHRTRYRPDPWRGPEWIVAACGALTAATMVWLSSVDAATVTPSVSPLRWPELPLWGVVAVAFGALPAWLTPLQEPLPVAARRRAGDRSGSRPSAPPPAGAAGEPPSAAPDPHHLDAHHLDRHHIAVTAPTSRKAPR